MFSVFRRVNKTQEYGRGFPWTRWSLRSLLPVWYSMILWTQPVCSNQEHGVAYAAVVPMLGGDETLPCKQIWGYFRFHSSDIVFSQAYMNKELPSWSQCHEITFTFSFPAHVLVSLGLACQTRVRNRLQLYENGLATRVWKTDSTTIKLSLLTLSMIYVLLKFH